MLSSSLFIFIKWLVSHANPLSLDSNELCSIVVNCFDSTRSSLLSQSRCQPTFHPSSADKKDEKEEKMIKEHFYTVCITGKRNFSVVIICEGKDRRRACEVLKKRWKIVMLTSAFAYLLSSLFCLALSYRVSALNGS
jgi:hypothetical protein